ncbi:hypothetical protein GF312_22735 [Candidatus Poribacteria bacterium]|nr:hypothetical protein [Candidatus Poribacteria bacterium]
MKLILSILLAVLILVQSTPAYKVQSVFFPPQMVDKARKNTHTFPWATDFHDSVIKQAEYWLKLTDDEIWNLVFSSNITRSWMVLSDGFCPNCKNDVPMYSWIIDAINKPWKVQCPHCKEFFPKNDFYKFYVSGLNENRTFDPQIANRSLLFNIEHPDSDDPLHHFGVDDGEGYIENGKRWRFIGAYLVYGQWKQLIWEGSKKLASAYVITGNEIYAHKALILLDRIADLYPTFNYKTQGTVYEKFGYDGYVSVWHDACVETRDLALVYDQVFDAIEYDHGLVDFLSRKSRDVKLANTKTSSDLIQRNIEDRILIDAINNPHKIYSNYPQTDITISIIKTILYWPENMQEIYTIIGDIIQNTTSVDGVSGEKGLASYSALAIQTLADFLGKYSRIQEGFLEHMIFLYPQLYQTYRFHIDTWCLQNYYPLSGDTFVFAGKRDQYVGVLFSDEISLEPSMFTFLWELYEATGDASFVQVIYHTNDEKLEGLPYDIFADDYFEFQENVENIISWKGKNIEIGSVNKESWHLAILRSGKDEDRRAVWIDYDSGGNHGHADGMNIGLFAKGLDLMPDFGYPPVSYGGWHSPQAIWYTMTAAHNTVVVNGRNQEAQNTGNTELWIDRDGFKATRISAANIINDHQYERTIAMIDISDSDSYIVDIFRIIGGTDHAKFMHSHFGQLITKGLTLKPTDDYGNNTLMRNFYKDSEPVSGWYADWKIDDRYNIISNESDIHLRYTDFTTSAEASVCEAWISYIENTDIQYNEQWKQPQLEAWIPRIMIRRQSQVPPLISNFVGIIEPYDNTCSISKIKRLKLITPDGKLYPDANVALEIELINGYKDIFISADTENPLNISPSIEEYKSMIQPKWSLDFSGEMCLVRFDNLGNIHQYHIFQGNVNNIERAKLSINGYNIFRKGDIDSNGQVNVKDAILILQISAGNYKPSSQQLYSGDMNNDGHIGANDAILTLRIIHDNLQ